MQQYTETSVLLAEIPKEIPQLVVLGLRNLQNQQFNISGRTIVGIH